MNLKYKKSFFSYLGGKSLLANKIIPFIPEHECYCEVFAGAAWLLFKKEPSKVEIINDINNDISNLYKVVKHHFEEFIKQFKFELVSRIYHEEYKKIPGECLTDIKRAAKFYYLLRTSFASRIENPSFSISTVRASNLNLLRLEEEISYAHLRLQRVYIENLNYDKFIERYDREYTFFYLDPPYFGCEDYYGKGIFDRADFANLSKLLSDVKGKFILSINDVPEIRNIFKEFFMKEVETTYSAGVRPNRKAKKKVKELLVANFEIK